MKYLITTPHQLSSALKSERKAQGLTQEEVGKRVGLLLKTISALENHPGSSSIDSLLKILSALGMELAIAPRGSGSPSAHNDASGTESW